MLQGKKGGALENHLMVLLLASLASLISACSTTQPPRNQITLPAAAESGNTEAISHLLNEGADINAKDSNGAAPLHAAANRGHKDVAALLIAKGADVSANDKNGTTPLHAAAFQGYWDIAELLIAKGADVNAKDKNGATPLHAAAVQGYRNIAELLIAKGGNVNAKNKSDDTPLHAAADRGHKDFVELLIAKGADVNAKNNNDATPLTIAANQGHNDISELLIAKGANVNAKDKNDDTPLNLAVLQGHKEVAELLLAKGAEVNAREDKDNATAARTASIEARQGFYVYIGLDLYSYKNAPIYSSEGFRIVGGYHFNRYMGVEAGYSVIRDSSDDSCLDFLGSCSQDSLSGSSSQVAVVGTLPLDDQHEVFGKLGWATTSLDYSYSYTPCYVFYCLQPTTGYGSATKTNKMYGIGWQRRSDDFQQLYFRVQYENFGTIKLTTTYNNQPTRTSDIGIGVFSFGLIGNF